MSTCTCGHAAADHCSTEVCCRGCLKGGCLCHHYTPTIESESVVSESLPRVISFDEIREGDHVERESHYCGARFRTDGIAAREEGGWWDTDEGATLAQRTDDNEPSVILRLLDRPKPPLPPLPTTLGIAIRATCVDGEHSGPATLVRWCNTSWRGASDDGLLIDIGDDAISDWKLLYDPSADA